MALKIAIVTPDHESLSIDCDEVVVPGFNGELGLLPGHVPVVSALRPGVLTVISAQKRSFYAVATGFAEIEGAQVTILTEACEESSKIDSARAQRALEQAETALAKLSNEDAGYAEQQRRAARARARLDACVRR